MLVKRLVLAIFLLLLLQTVKVAAFDYPPGVFINDLPGPIEIKPGEEPKIPIFLLMGPFADQKVEFYLWREWQGDDLTTVPLSKKEYLDSNLTWQPFVSYEELKPLVAAALPLYLRFDWRSDLFLAPFDWENNPPPSDLSYTLYLCFDAILDNLPPSEEEFSSNPPQAVCGSSRVVFANVCQATDVRIEGLENGLDVFLFPGFEPSYTFEIRDNCERAPRCQIEEKPSFLTASLNDGTLDLGFVSGLKSDTYQGDLVLSCDLGGTTVRKQIPIHIEVSPVPGSCKGQIILEDDYGQKYLNGATINLSAPQNFKVKCVQKVLIVEAETILLNFAFTPGGNCFMAQKENSQLVLSPIGDMSCTDRLKVGAGTVQADFTVRIVESNNDTCTLAVSPTTLSFNSSGTKTVYVKDTCGRSLSYKVSSVSVPWITSPRAGDQGTGTLSIRVSTTGLTAGTHTGKVVIEPEGYSPVTIEVSVSIPQTTSVLTVWPTEISETLESGTSKEKTLSVTCSGRVPSRCSAKKISGEDWLTVSGCEGSIITVGLNTAGLVSGNTYTGSISISTSCGSKTIPVTLNVSGVCEPTTAKLSQSVLSLAVQVGKSPSAQTIYVRDNCGQPVSFSVRGISYSPEVTQWLTYDVDDESLTLTFNTASLEVGAYSATIEIDPEGYEPLELTVKLSIEELPSTPPVSTITLTREEEYTTRFAPGEAKLFSFRAGSTATFPLSVMVSTPSSYSSAYLNMLLVNAGPECTGTPPSVSDIQELIAQYEAGEIRSVGSLNNEYWYLGGLLVKNLYVREDVSSTCWYLLVYNSSDTTTYDNVEVGYTGGTP